MKMDQSSRLRYGQKVGMTGKMELEKLPKCWGDRELKEDVGSFMGLSNGQIEMLNDSIWPEKAKIRMDRRV